MSEAPAASFSFLSWVRQALAVGAVASGDGRLSLPIRLRVAGATTHDVDTPALLYGPGDVTGLDPHEVVRTEPVSMTTDFEPNYFPLIEFDHPDLPWMFSSNSPNTAGRLHPWICLATVRQDACSLDPGVPLPVLTCPRSELPNPAEAWAWAHAQVAHSETERDLNKLLSSDPARSVSRLLSPRRLDAQTSYYACLVPVYEIGRKAGLGEPVTPEDERALRYAWAPDAPGEGSTRLPVYYHWEFRTGEREDFEALVTRLQPNSLPDTLGLRPMDIREPGWTLPTLPPGTPGTAIGLEGALRTLKMTSTPWPDEARTPFQQRLRRILNMPADQASPEGTEAPIVTPPIYGQWYPNAARVPEDDGQPRWLADLNLDPRDRVAAGMGAAVVRFEQEPLMAAAWEQLAADGRDEEAQRRKELSHEVDEALCERHFAPLDTERLTQVTAPIQPTLKALGMATTSENGEGGVDGNGAGAIVAEASTRQPSATPIDPTLSVAFRRQARHVHDSSVDTGDAAVAHPSGEATTVELMAREEGAPAPELPIRDHQAEALLAALGPATPTLPGTVAALEATGSPTAAASEPQEEAPIRFAPRFTTPMYEALRDYFPEALLPGMEQIPPNTIALMETNPRFIESFLVGLNHEMSRELLWREYPVNRQGTFFRHFWDTRGRTSTTGGTPPESAGDIRPILDWDPSSRLGENTTGDAGEAEGRIVLLVRGDLLRRYPRALIYAARAKWAEDGSGRREPLTGPENEEYPLFRATRTPDITLLGFGLTELEVRGEEDQASGLAGWFFVIQEQPTELRFGLDEALRYGEEAPESWSDLTWGHFAPSEEALKRLVYIPLTGALRDTRPRRTVPWGANGAHMAYITQQKPFRINIHARAWVWGNE